jgi:glycosyltransferase involved in cell wall biosynthesis
LSDPQLTVAGLPKRVLHVMNSAAGGAAISTIELIEALRKRGIDSVVACIPSGNQEELDRVRQAARGRVLFRPLYWWNRKIRARPWRRPFIEAKLLWRTGFVRSSTRDVASFAQEMQVDLIHTNTILTPEGGYAARRLHLPHIWHIRELIGPGRPFRFHLEGRRFGDFVTQYASYVVANSQTTADQIAAWLPENRLCVVPNGMDAMRFVPARSDTPHSPLVVAMVGNFSSITKRHGAFIEAAGLVDRNLKIEFRFYGRESADAEERARFHRRTAELNLTDRFRFMGFVNDPIQIMSDIDALVHMSEDESFGRIYVEAMAAGKPVIAARGGAAPEIVQHGMTGFLTDSGNLREIAGCIEQLARETNLHQRYSAACIRRAEEFSLERTVELLEAVYRKALTRGIDQPATQKHTPSSKIAPQSAQLKA